MSWLQFIKELYSPEALDTRFVISSKVPPRQALEERDNAKKFEPLKDAQAPLWLKPEFFFYYVMFILVFPQMVKSPMDVSQRKSS
jgi:hypothetical protein